MLLIIVWWGVLSQAPLWAQSDAARDGRPKVGLALSGGGAKGFAHIGVLQELEALGLPIDVVTGTSMGCIVGGLYAMGLPADSIEAITGAQDWTTMFSDAAPRRLLTVEQRQQEERYVLSLPLNEERRPGLPAGLVVGHRISTLLSHLTFPAYNIRDFTQLPIPLACVATDLETGEGVRFQSGYLPQVIRASMSLPSILTPVSINGRVYVDGGTTRNLPAEDAYALGADAVVCVDVGEPLASADSLTSLDAILNQTVSFRMVESTIEQQKKCSVLISPDIAGLSGRDFNRFPELIKRGRQSVAEALPQLQTLIDTLGHASAQKDVAPLSLDSVLVHEVRVDHVDEVLAEQVKAALHIQPPLWLSSSDIETAMSRMYSRELFATISYTLEPNETGGATLILHPIERSQEWVGLGLRFDSHYRAAIMLNASIRPQQNKRNTLDAFLRFGEIIGFGAFYKMPVSLQPRVGVKIFAQGQRAPIDIFEGGNRVASVRSQVLELQGRTDIGMGKASVLSLELGGELYTLDQSVGVNDFLEEASALGHGAVRLYLDSFDHVAFPKKGHQLLIRSAFGMPFDAGIFSYHTLHWRARWPLSNKWSASSRITVGQAFGNAIPLHYRFYLGGAFESPIFQDRQFPLLGFAVNELSGRSINAVGFGLQYQLGNVYIHGVWNAAFSSDEKRLPDTIYDLENGFGISLGTNTLIGPVSITLMNRNGSLPTDLQINVGLTF